MLQYHSYNIVFQEVPGEVTLAINLSNCPNGCKGCHSPYLQDNKGDVLDTGVIDNLLIKYGKAITCICFMGGDANPQEVEKLSHYIRRNTNFRLKTAWYSGKVKLPEYLSISNFNYIKLGPYIENLGGLDSPKSNQRFYKIENNEMIDLTCRFITRKQKHD
ncbi:MAG: anaerobic ribonucleoside-triphosphate reductase activating protein [Bacteroidales bacterium]|nr:anaerobic ribonucleoside-triphosphate reductase activating protein [Bacteroidales bacterium]